MDFLLDTNILLYYLRNQTSIIDYVDKRYQPFASANTAIISIVSIGELKAIGLRNNWGQQRFFQMNRFLSQLLKADINAEDVFDAYAEIDTFSQGHSKTKQLIGTARNMGKNDLWIAATASVLNATLLTTDKDFQHIKGVFLDVELINIAQISPNL